MIYCASAEDTKGMKQFMPSRYVCSEGRRPEDYAEGPTEALKRGVNLVGWWGLVSDDTEERKIVRFNHNNKKSIGHTVKRASQINDVIVGSLVGVFFVYICI